MKNNKSLLIVFIKNATLGKAKTRIAKDVGDQTALDIYQRLLNYTQEVASSSKLNLWVFYSDEIVVNSSWLRLGFKEFLQEGDDLGERMKNAFQLGLKSFDKVILIGSDCAELSKEHLLQASRILDKKDIVYGPALDGGYYLIGMKKEHDCLFDNLPWSGAELMQENLSRMKSNKLSFELLERLSDIDYIEDWEKVTWR